MQDRRGACTVLVGRPNGKRPLGRTRLRWENNIKMDLQEPDLAEGWDGWRAIVSEVMNIRIL
jgi:hypothetical protein